MSKVLFLDTETTGPDPALARICEIGLALLDVGNGAATKEEQFSSFVSPGEPIPPEASAVHHITNEMVKDAPAISNQELIEAVRHISNDAEYFVAHNLPYDLEILKREIPSVFGSVKPEQCIDTLRWSRHILKNIPSYGLQALRYRYGFLTPEGDPHRALFDVDLCIQLFNMLLEMKPKEISELPEAIARPLIVQMLNFGKHRGENVKDVIESDEGWVRWFLRQPWARVERPDLVFTFEMFLPKK
jgi:DNA polymerase III epsilon subunit-like protein